MKIKFLSALSGTNTSFKVGDEGTFNDDEAVRLVEAGIAEPTNKKAYAALLKKKEKEQLEKEENEKKASVLLHKDSLLEERRKWQNRVDELTQELGDGVEWYESYQCLAEDLKKKEEK